MPGDSLKRHDCKTWGGLGKRVEPEERGKNEKNDEN